MLRFLGRLFSGSAPPRYCLGCGRETPRCGCALEPPVADAQRGGTENYTDFFPVPADGLLRVLHARPIDPEEFYAKLAAHIRRSGVTLNQRAMLLAVLDAAARERNPGEEQK